MKYWLDTEFVDTGSIIDLISIGIVAEDGRELYCQHVNYDASRASEWVQENVLPHLEQCEGGGGRLQHSIMGGQCMGRYLTCGCPWYTRIEIKDAVRRFMDIEKYDTPELWSWCGAYDFVAFCQLFGTMMDLPPSYPHYMRDLQQVLDERGISDEELPGQEEGLHHALEDARHLKRLWGYIIRNDCWQ